MKVCSRRSQQCTSESFYNGDAVDTNIIINWVILPYDVKINENAARAIEYAYDDWCIYRMGEKLGVRQKNWNL